MLSGYGCCQKARPNEINLQEFIELSQSNIDTISFLLCDYRQYNHLYNNKQWGTVYQAIGRNSKYLDISLPYNREVQYINCFEHLPVVVSTDNNGIHKIVDCSGTHNVDKAKELLNAVFLKCYHSLSSTPDSILFSRIINDTSLSTNFYCRTLLARYYEKTHRNDSAQREWERAAILYEYNPDKITEPLYIEAMRKINDTLPHILITPRLIDIGTIPAESKVNRIVTISNYGKRPYILYNVRPTCSCVKVTYSRIIKPNTKDTMVVSYLADKEPGPFEQRININSKHNIITIKGIKK